MITDFEILRISETEDLSVIRKAYRKLVKEIHPDVSGDSDSLRNHLLFIRINQAYGRLIGSFKDQQRACRPRSASKPGGRAVVQHKDPAYAFYKTAMTDFMKIHPSQWSIDAKRILNKQGLQKEKELEKIKQKVRNLVKLFPRAYYYFSIVVHEYPDSPWFQDAKDKMNLIEERTTRYKRIIESFTEHAKEVPRINKMFYRTGS